MTWGFVCIVAVNHIVQQQRQEIRARLPVDVRFLVPRNRREGGYCGKDVAGNHFRAGHMTPNKWDTPYPTLRQWHRSWRIFRL